MGLLNYDCELDPTHSAWEYQIMPNPSEKDLRKCQSCQRALTNWQQKKVCGKSLSPDSCGWHYIAREDLAVALTEGVFK